MYHHNRRRLLIFIVLFFVWCNCMGQSTYDKLPNRIPPLPEAAALGQYGERPINLYTGRVNINIPIYELVSKDIHVPLSLNYATGGVKVQDIATQVGLNWTLNAGGLITRSVRGKADDLSGGLLFPSLPAAGASNLSEEDQHNFLVANYDGESDIYYYNFNGNSGSFFFDRAGNIHTSEFSNFKISKTSGTKEGVSGFISFQIIDDNGFTYIFDNIESQVTCTSSTTSGNIEATSFGPYTCMPQHISSWYLTKIVSPLGNVVNFEYETFTQAQYEVPGSQTRYLVDKTKQTDNDYQTFMKKSFKSKLTINSDHAKRLTRIVGDNVIIEFVKGALRQDLVSNYALGQILVKDKQNKIVKNYTFKYGYTSGDPRLSLKAFNKVSVLDTALKESYKFIYDESPLPSRFSNGMDHWGYNNGKGAINTHLIPTTTVGTDYYAGANRDPDFNSAIIGSLTGIQYPTGGTQRYIYEANQSFTSFPVTTSVGDGISMQIFAYNGFPGVNWSSCSVVTESYKDFVVPSTVNAEIYMSMPDNNSNPINPSIYWELWNMDTNTQLVYNSSFYEPIAGPSSSGIYNYKYPGTLVLNSGVHYRIIHKIVPCRYNRSATYYNFQLSWSTLVTANQSADLTVGGVRVRSISNYDNNGSLLTQHDYLYKEAGHSSGYLPFYPIYFHQYRESISAIRPTGLPGGGNEYRTINGYSRVGTSQPFYLGQTQTNSVGYSNVEETINGQQKISYFYTSPNEVKDQLDLGNGSMLALQEANYNDILYDKPFSEIFSNDWARGLLTQKIAFRYLNGQFEPVQKETYDNDISYGTISPNYFSESFLKVSCNFNDRVNNEPMGDGTGYTVAPLSSWPNVNNIYWYKVHNYKSFLKSTKTETASSDDLTKWTTNFVSNRYSANNFRLSQVIEVGSKGDTTVLNYNYPLDIAGGQPLNPVDNLGIQNLINKNLVAQPVEVYRQLNKASGVSSVLFSKLTTYNNNLPVPETIQQTESASPILNFLALKASGGNLQKNSAYQPQVNFSKYDNYGNILQQQQKGSSAVSFQWGYNAEYPVAKVINSASNNFYHENFEESTGNSAPTDSRTGVYSHTGAYTKALSGLNAGNYVLSYWQKSGSVWLLVNTPVTITGSTYTIGASPVINSQIDDVLFYPADAQMSTYTYDSLVGMTSATDAKGLTTYYEYDGFQRLMNIKDKDGKIVKNYQYNYAGQQTTTYSSAAKSGSFTKNCGTGTGSTVTYTVAAGTYTSTISQGAADQLAQNDVNANGPAYANVNGTCTYSSAEKSGPFTRSCGAGMTGSTVTYTVAAGTYTSTVSQAAADQQALDYMNANGPAYATANGTCTVICTAGNCTSEGSKCVNGICEAGLRTYTSSVQIHGSVWQCTYYYMWSDGSVSGSYTGTSSAPCLNE
jgi:hypothetical protein